ncbi:hypothetical protein [Flavobacterium chungangense]|uniref:Uncharacterized protein n=2 Tax=Flavobacterium TaxID=237 RepID=A0A6V6Z1V4_9FLAO|nr:hypothetical protein [Flavobacterium chungangense]CAD0005703.1 hypothetical protein FLACHUCJ7_02500 [Flavobacterium chungangense]CAD0005863.1 hypothetical protein FLAT13_03016 [Flavobacterium salmonis]
MENIQNILVFATNIRTVNDKQLISCTLNENSEIHQWNIDQEDIDCVLRVVSETLSEEQIINIVNRHNFNCRPLD